MSDRRFKVILEGTIRKGADRSEVVNRLAKIFNKDLGTMERLLGGEPRIIRRHVNHATALKYRQVMERAGAAARLEPEIEPPVNILTNGLPEENDVPQPERGAIRCPRCGYESNREDDVLRVRGDCPRCGLQVRKLDDLADPLGKSEEDLSLDEKGESQYEGKDAASWERRACAAMYTFAFFLALCFFFVLMSIFLFVPIDSVGEYLTKKFFEAAFTAFPILTASAGIFIVLFVMPFAMEGRTWGQHAFNVQLLFTDEGQTGGLPLTLAFRTVAAGLMSFVPGRLLLWILSWWGIYPEWRGEWILMGFAALLAWSVAWVYGIRRTDHRGFLDIAAGTVQVEDNVLPAGALLKACRPLAGMIGLIVFIGAVLPYAMRWLYK